ncbi:hypothetical protein I316_05725 [Kwoniella heveanensis BCC8398]|uniref:Uncharacterized protein n=1 Tax=Kwoniella heveanensis BCC8398 TaxID=1296120 RepID=A0A1B9GP10_9TREE|nr:hypothetical protein I316_05725 [Kwoniella heveanensis BCC8398]
MPPRRPLKRRGEDDDRSPARQNKKVGKNKREQTYDTYDEALDGGVEMEEKGERYRDGDKSQRFYEKAIELYAKAFGYQETYDAAYNQARALYTLSTSFLLPPASLPHLRKSIEMYKLATSLTNSPLLRMDVGFNLSQSCSALADVLEDLDSEASREEVRKLREEARDVLQDVMDGQEAYLNATGEENDEAEAEEVVEEVEGGAEADSMQVDPDPLNGEDDEEEGDAAGDGDKSATFETHLPTPSTFIDTVLSLLDLHLSLWESTSTPRTPTEEEQTAVRAILDRAAPLAPPGRQAELDLAEIKVLLTMDSIVWDLFKLEAKVGMGLERSLEGAIAALGAVLASLDVTPPEEQTVRPDILTTLADTHMATARRMMFLNAQLPAGPSPLAQQAWFHLSQAITHLSAALDLPTSALTPREFKPSVLLSLSKASLARARLAPIHETAQRNVVQLLDNATTYAARAGEGLGWKFMRIDGTAPTASTGLSLSIGGGAGINSGGDGLPWPAGWEAEALGRIIAFQQIRVCLFASKTDLLSEEARARYTTGLGIVIGKLKGLGASNGDRKIGSKDLERFLGEIEDDEGGVLEVEKAWWAEILA